MGSMSDVRHPVRRVESVYVGIGTEAHRKGVRVCDVRGDLAAHWGE